MPQPAEPNGRNPGRRIADDPTSLHQRTRSGGMPDRGRGRLLQLLLPRLLRSGSRPTAWRGRIRTGMVRPRRSSSSMAMPQRRSRGRGSVQSSGWRKARSGHITSGRTGSSACSSFRRCRKHRRRWRFRMFALKPSGPAAPAASIRTRPRALSGLPTSRAASPSWRGRSARSTETRRWHWSGLRRCSGCRANCKRSPRRTMRMRRMIAWSAGGR